MRFLWAAYRLGAFEKFFAGAIAKEDFEKEILARLAGAVGVWVLIAPHDGTTMPVGIAIAWWYPRLNAHMRQITGVWFPWATARNKIESTVNFAQRMRATQLLTYVGPISETAFFERVCRYGVGRRFGTVKGFFGKGKDAAWFQTVDVA